jgi:hypothetical protein
MTKSKVPAFIISHSGVISIYGDKNYVIGTDHPNHAKIKDALRNGNYDDIPVLADIPKVIEKTAATVPNSGVEVKDGQIFYKGEVCHNAVSERILEWVREGFPFGGLVKFLENLMQNTSKKSLDNLYRFLEVNRQPITEDGYFIAYKRVRDDYKDFYSGKFDNSVGQTVEMPRNEVEDDPNWTCSHGLHVANLDYAKKHYHSGQGRLIVVKVNPADVVSVPTDYNSSKMRVCKYVVLQDLTDEVELTQSEVTPAEPEPDSGWDYGDYDDNDS